jgi:DNA-directed RNA polymerase alpha subunit
LVRAYAEENDVAIRDLPISAREFNTLRLNGIEKISQLVVAIPESVAESSLVGTVVRGLRRDYLRQHKQALIQFVEGKVVVDAKTDATADEKCQSTAICKLVEDGKRLLDMPKKKTEILQLLIARATPIEDLGLSVRSYNALRRAFIDQVHKALALYPDGFVELRNLGKKSVDEICQVLEITAAKIEQEIEGGADVGTEEPVLLPEDISIETVASDFSLMELLEHPAFKEKAKRCLKEVDVPIETMGFGVRAVNALKNASIFTFSAILPIYPDGIASLRNIGAKTVTEIQEKVSYYLAKLRFK